VRYGARPEICEDIPTPEGAPLDADSNAAMPKVAYFCMEYGLGESLPLYAGGLGILAGDHLKAAGDIGCR